MRGTRRPRNTTSTSAAAPRTILCCFYRWVSRSGDFQEQEEDTCGGNSSAFSSLVAGCLEKKANGVGILVSPTGKPWYTESYGLSSEHWSMFGDGEKSVCAVKASCFCTERACGILISRGVCLSIPHCLLMWGRFFLTPLSS